MNWYGGTVVLGDGKTCGGVPGRYYRTCDRCITEMGFGSTSNRMGTNSSSSTGDSSVSTDNTKFVDIRTRSNTVASSSSEPVSSHRDNATDDNLCPVCATNLLSLYVNDRKPRSDDWHEHFERFKENHICDCLTNYDFDTSHDRFTLPTNHPRNKMLVYNIPPIPRPQYETIGEGLGSSSSGGVHGSYSTVVGSVTSASTVTEKEKDDFDNECVICLEELNPGDKVGRLECLCVFHYGCIKDWFNTKGVGECPVHFLHQ